MLPITQVSDSMGLDPETVLPYGKHEAKISLDAIRAGDPKGKIILVTAVTPTRAGEGKTTVTVGLTQAIGRLGHRVAATLREPSLGPIVGIKKGGRHRRQRVQGSARGRNQHSLHGRCPRRVLRS